jgi:non-canonical poly(A) RNA polymerase PAPD5/7
LSPQDKGLILCFGSYPAGLYLPTADMDLVYTSQRHYNGGPPVFDPQYDKPALKKTLYKASNRLQKVGIADKVNVIIHAKVPIIKFNDRVTKLAVDISFENLSGVQAQATFQKWKEQYPDMIYMVALVKQLLVMRGLNEVHTGGLGGFTIICLIVSYLEHSEKADNLGDCFIGFLRYYGKTFDLAKQRIQMSPPAIVRKVSNMGLSKAT